MAKVSLRYKGPRKTPFGGEIHGKSWAFDPSKEPKEGAENLLKVDALAADVLVSTAPDLWERVDDSDEPEQAQPVEQNWPVKAASEVIPADSGYVFGADFGTGSDYTPDESTGKKGKR